MSILILYLLLGKRGLLLGKRGLLLGNIGLFPGSRGLPNNRGLLLNVQDIRPMFIRDLLRTITVIDAVSPSLEGNIFINF